MAAINETRSNEGTTVEVGTQTNHFCADFTVDLDNSQSSEAADRSYFNSESATLLKRLALTTLRLFTWIFIMKIEAMRTLKNILKNKLLHIMSVKNAEG